MTSSALKRGLTARTLHIGELMTDTKRVPPDLDPRNFPHRVGGLDNQGEPSEILGVGNKAFTALSESLQSVYERERVIRADKTRTPADHRMRVARLAGKAKEAAAESVQSAFDKLTAHIATIDAHIAEGKKSAMSIAEAQEIRAFVRGLSNDERAKFISEADAESLSALLSAKPFLSGMGDAEAALVDRRLVQENFPGLLELREKLDKSRDVLQNGWANYDKEISSLIPGDASAIEKAAADADEAARATS